MFVFDVIAHVRYIKILTWLWGFGDKIAIFDDSIVSQFPEKTWAQRNQTKYRNMTMKRRTQTESFNKFNISIVGY